VMSLVEWPRKSSKINGKTCQSLTCLNKQKHGFKIFLDVNQILYNHSAEHKECKGMGTTIVIAVCTEEFFTVAHVGDSRCYLLNEYGFKQITEDHSLVNALIQSGQISKSDAQQHPRKNVVLKALGTE